MTAAIIMNLMDVEAGPPVPGVAYWLIEYTDPTSGQIMYYTAPSFWSDSVDLATKFHGEQGANDEMVDLTAPTSASLLVASHVWVS